MRMTMLRTYQRRSFFALRALETFTCPSMLAGGGLSIYYFVYPYQPDATYILTKLNIIDYVLCPRRVCFPAYEVARKLLVTQ